MDKGTGNCNTSKLKDHMKEFVNTVDTLNFDFIDSSFLKRGLLENIFKEINKLYSHFDANRNSIRYINRNIYPSILKQISKISERCKNDELKVAYIRESMISQILSQVHYLYNFCDSKPFDYEVKFIEQFVIPKCLKMFGILYKNFGTSSEFNKKSRDEMISVMKDCGYHGHLTWSRALERFFFVPHKRRKPKDYVDPVCGREEKRLVFGGDYFASCLDGLHILHFLNKFQMEKSDVITLQYVKSIALYTALIKLPIAFINFFFTEQVDDFLRSLLVYFQYYLQVWKVAQKRAEMRKTKLPHSNSEINEAVWRNNLNDLRFFVGRNYSAIILGVKELADFHHLRSSRGINTTTDYLLYELLYDFSAKIAMIVLNSTGEAETNNVIKDEINRLFREKGTTRKENNSVIVANQERGILEGKFRIPRDWKCHTPCITEVKRPGRDPRIFHIGTAVIKTRDVRIRILQASLLVPDEYLKKANMKIGILGKPKNDFPPLVTCYQFKRQGAMKAGGIVSQRKPQEDISNRKSWCEGVRNGSENDSASEASGSEDGELVENVETPVKSLNEKSLNEKTKQLVALELFTLLLFMKKARRKQEARESVARKLKERHDTEKLVSGEGTHLVEKDFPKQPYCLGYKLLRKTKTFKRADAITLWTKHREASKRFFYRIDPYSSIVDEYFNEK